MAVEVIMPRLTHDMQTGVFVGWLKKDGDLVTVGEPIFEVETDKAISEVEAETAGVLRGLRYSAGDDIPIGSMMAYILKEGEKLLETPVAGQPVGKLSPVPASPEPVQSLTASRVTTPLTDAAPTKGGHIIATPIAKRIARENQLDLALVIGSGPRGRIVEADVLAYLASIQQTSIAQADAETPFIATPLTRYQRITGTRLQESVRSAPHFHLEVEVDMGEAIRWREQQNPAKDLRISFTSILLKVVAHALAAHPQVNASFAGDHVKLFQDVNVGLAIAVGEGLLVPVVHQADRLSISQIQQTLNHLRVNAETGKLKPAQLSGGTFTISNLGMYGIDCFQAIINPPEAAILAVGRIRELPIVTETGIDVHPMMNMRLSIDHRVLDGATAAPFLVEIKETLENPCRLI